jgi:hypothetical protein
MKVFIIFKIQARSCVMSCAIISRLMLVCWYVGMLVCWSGLLRYCTLGRGTNLIFHTQQDAVYKVYNFYVCLCVSLPSLLGKGSVNCIPPFVARQRLRENVATAMNTQATIGEIFDVSFLSCPCCIKGN